MSPQRRLTHIPLYTFLQLMEAERETCILHIQEQQNCGTLYLQNGHIIDAETDKTRGEKALKTILTWARPFIETTSFTINRDQTIVKPLISVAIDAFKHKLKAAKEKDSMENQLKLQQLSTEKFPLTFDESTILSVEFVDFDCPFSSGVVGMQQNDFIIVRTPKNLSEEKDPSELVNKALLVKYIHAGRKTIFKTNVLVAIDNPAPLLFFDYPGSIHFHELRRIKRTLIMVPCTLHTRDTEEYYGMLVDLSPRGGLCQIKSKGNPSLSHIKKEASISLRCLLPGLKDEQRVNGIVRNIRADKQSTKLGIEFVDMSDQVKAIIEKYLYTVQKSKK